MAHLRLRRGSTFGLPSRPAIGILVLLHQPAVVQVFRRVDVGEDVPVYGQAFSSPLSTHMRFTAAIWASFCVLTHRPADGGFLGICHCLLFFRCRLAAFSGVNEPDNQDGHDRPYEDFHGSGNLMVVVR